VVAGESWALPPAHSAGFLRWCPALRQTWYFIHYRGIEERE
jgi:hypothetical protein